MSLSLDSNTEVPTPIMTDLQDIASMIQVNEEATVSRTVMHAEGVRLVLFSFDKDEILSEHTAAMPVILHTDAARSQNGARRSPRCPQARRRHPLRHAPAARRARARALEDGPVHAGSLRAPQGLRSRHCAAGPVLVR